MARKATVKLSAVALLTSMAILGGPTLGSQAAADEFPVPKVDFSADMVTHASNLGGPGAAAPGQPPKSMEITGKMYQSAGNTRQEVSMSGMQTVMINRRDKKTMWSLMPMTKTYMEFPYDQAKHGGASDMESFWKSHDAKLEK